MIGLRERVGLRILAVAVLAVLLSFSVQALLVNWLLVNKVVGHLVRTMDVVGDDEIARCEADPGRWQLGDGVEMDGWAFDPATGTSVNPAAPVVDPFLWGRWTLGESDPVRLLPSGPWGGHILLDLHRPGPCGLVELRWVSGTGDRLRFLTQMAALGVLVSGAAAVGAIWFAVRPLIRRVERLGDAAARVGTADFRPVGGDGGDALAALARVMDDAHGRIVAEVAEREAASAARERHLARVAHDLGTPLAAARLALEEHLGTDDAPAVRAALAELVYLSVLTENLRLQARIEHGAVAPVERVELGALVDRVADRFARLGALLGIEVAAARPDAPVVVLAPAVEVEQAISNLVHNAVRHHPRAVAGTGDEGHVTLLLEAVDGAFTLWIVDAGAGMPDDGVERLTGDAVDDTTVPEPARANGLGLAIVRDGLRRAGWRLTVTRGAVNADGGEGGPSTTVRIDGPLAPPP